MGGPSPSVWDSHQTPPLLAQSGLGLQSQGGWRSSGQELAEAFLLLSASAASSTATTRPEADKEQGTQAGGRGPGAAWGLVVTGPL